MLMCQLKGFSKFRIKVQEAEQENHTVDEDPASRRSPELYLPCEAEKTTAGFHPLHVGSDEGVNRGDVPLFSRPCWFPWCWVMGGEKKNLEK